VGEKMSKVLTQAQIYAPNIEPIETIKLLAKSHALYEMARIMQVSPSTMRGMPVISAIATDMGKIKTRVRTRRNIG